MWWCVLHDIFKHLVGVKGFWKLQPSPGFKQTCQCLDIWWNTRVIILLLIRSVSSLSQKIILEIYKDITTCVFRIGAGQFLHDFRRDYHIQKFLAHRKALLIKKEKLRERQMNVHLSDISKARNPRKKISHARLLSLAEDVKSDGLASLYNKNELQILCKGYAVACLSTENDGKVASALVAQSRQNQFVLCHQEQANYYIN